METTPPVLRKMFAATATATVIGRRDVAALLLGFALAARRPELRLLDWADVAEVEAGLAVDAWRRTGRCPRRIRGLSTTP
ncbi:hypothetical protein [Streptomyces sp. IBSBF 2806]|uniref:hypothetical protein n=1 Tax=Streptomyces sp. IBSBF 2806 TaxID=2903529 RepID=UPI002FDC0096